MRDWSAQLRARLAPLNLAPGREAEIVEELSRHLDEHYRDLIASGLDPREAERAALSELNRVEFLVPQLASLPRAHERQRVLSLQDNIPSGRRWTVSDLVQDVRYALRRLRSAPVFAVTAILTLALGIGANTAIFSLVHGVLLRPLPFPDPDRLYALYSANKTADSLRAPVSPPDLDDWRSQRRSIEDLGGYFYAEGSTGVNLTGRGSPRRLSAVFVTPGFLSTLGVQAAKGRLPREDELVRGGKDTVVLLTHGFWSREFGGSESIVGSSLTLNDKPYDVIGVLPLNLRFPEGDIDVMVPHSTIPDSAVPRIRPVRVLSVVARAKPGVGADGVRAEMQAITSRLAAQYPEDRAWDGATVVPLAEVITGPVQAGLRVLLGAVGFVLLMACVNVTNLQLARVMGRAREIAVRVALGSGRARLIQLLLVESIVVAAIGGIAGLVLATFGVRSLLALSAGQLPRASEVSLDTTVLLFAAGVSLAVGVAVGLAPIWRVLRGDLSGALRDNGRSVAGASHNRLRRTLLVAEVAFAMMLVVGAGLMSRSFLALLAVDTGFKPDHLLAVQFTIDGDRHSRPVPATAPATSPSRSTFTGYYSEVIEAVRRLPGIESAAAVKDPPFRGNGERNSFLLPGQVLPAGEDPPTATTIHVSDGYFRTIGARVDGREFVPTDTAGAPLVVVINQTFARTYFPGDRAVGKRILLSRNVPAEIVGVIDDIRQVAMAEPAKPTMYLHNLQNSRSKTTIVARTKGAPLEMADAIRRTIWSIDKDQPISAVFTFDDAVGRAMARPRLLTVLLGAFGILGLGLGAIGLYGVVAALVGERRREIGVRLALGAEPRQVLTMVIRSGLTLALTGVVIGLAGAFVLSRFLDSVLYGIGPADPLTFGGTAGLFVLTALAASWLPARRAAKLNPVETLAAE